MLAAILYYNPSNELDGQGFRVKNISTENDPSGGVGWVLIAMDGNVICNIGRNKSDIRNTKNQNFEISESWNDVPESWNDVSESWIHKSSLD